jgi:hypothetical protein
VGEVHGRRLQLSRGDIPLQNVLRVHSVKLSCLKYTHYSKKKQNAESWNKIAFSNDAVFAWQYRIFFFF